MSRKQQARPEDLQAKLIEIVNRRMADAIRETKMLLPDGSLPEVDAEAMERWLDDGGASGHQAAYDARNFSPLSFFRSEGGLS